MRNEQFQIAHHDKYMEFKVPCHMPRNVPVDQLPLDTLAHHCGQETARFLRHEEHDDSYCRELLRRAFVLMDEESWKQVYTRYRAMVANWVRNHTRFAQCGETEDAFVHDAFIRMANAFRQQPQKFEKVDSVARLLAYLKLCCHSAIMAYLEKQHAAAQTSVELNDELTDVPKFPSAHRVVTQNMLRHELWSLIQARINTEKEAVVVHCMFMQEQKLRVVYRDYAHLFSEPREISRIKYNLLERLRRDPVLQQFWAENNWPMEDQDHE